MTNDTWGQVRDELLRVVGKNNFSAWIAPIGFDRIEGRTALFNVPTTFFGSWVSQNFGDVILRHLHSAGVGVDRVEFKVGASAPQADNDDDAPVAAPARAPELAMAGEAIADKIHAVATRIYGAKDVAFTKEAQVAQRKIAKLGYDKLPVCIAKTQSSLSDDPKQLGRPTDFTLTVRDFVIQAGAGFVVALTGDIMRMPGLPRRPAAEKIDLVDGRITGLS